MKNFWYENEDIYKFLQEQLTRWFEDKNFTYEDISKLLLQEFKLNKSSESIRHLKRDNRIELGKVVVKKKLPKILIFDLETSTIRFWGWRTGQQYVGPKQVLKESFMLSWSAKWLFDPKVIHDRVTGEEAIERNDKRIVERLWHLIDDANIIVAHNLVQFDRRKMNARFLKHNLPHPSPYQLIDTLQIARKEFQLESSSLDYICKYLGLPQKTDTDYKLWLDCEEGDERALREMDMYCRNDVKILEEVYLRLRPYSHSHPNVGLYTGTDEMVCSVCGSSELTSTEPYYTPANKYTAKRCECGAITRMRAGLLNGKIEGRSTAR